MTNKATLIISLVLLSLVVSLAADRNKNRAYVNIQKSIPCIRRFNATHQIGCSARSANVNGVVYLVRNELEYLRLITKIKSLGEYKLILVCTADLFERCVRFYKNGGGELLLNGIVLMENYNQTSSAGLVYSDDSESPNARFGAYVDQPVVKWNSPAGRSFLFDNYDIPMYVLDDQGEHGRIVDDCYEKFNRQVFERADTEGKFTFRSSDFLCGMQLGLQMSGAVSSTVCTRRSSIIHTLDINFFCDPLGGSSYFTFVSQAPTNERPIMVVSARMDAFSLFEYYTPAAAEPVSSLIGLLSVVETLASKRTDLDRMSLLVVLFDNEAFDYGGSSRFARDLVQDLFPTIELFNKSLPSYKLDKDRISSLVEFNQLGSLSVDGDAALYVHRDPVSYKANKTIASLIDDLTDKLKSNSNGKIQPVSDANQQMPPSSAHAFLRHNISLAAVSIGDYDKSFKNQHYHSIFDTAENMNIQLPANITEWEAYQYTTPFSKNLQPLLTSIARSIYLSASSKTATEDVVVDPTTVNKLVYCFYVNTSCAFFRGILSDQQWSAYQKLLVATQPAGRLSFYTSVNDNLISGKYITSMVLRYFTRNRDLESLNATNCNKDSNPVKDYQAKYNVTIRTVNYLNNSYCLAVSIYAVSSVSPAFDKYEDGLLLNTDKYSAWTESSWNGVDVQMRLFMFTCDSVRYLSISLGIVVTLAAIGLTYFFNKYSSQWFLLKNSAEVTSEFFE